jgi:hypothetical protein
VTAREGWSDTSAMGGELEARALHCRLLVARISCFTSERLRSIGVDFAAATAEPLLVIQALHPTRGPP